MPRPVHGLARQRTTLAWQRTALDFVVVGGLLLRAAQGFGSPLRVLPAGLAWGMSAFVLVAVRLGSRPGRRHPGRRTLYALGCFAISLQLSAAVLILPL